MTGTKATAAIPFSMTALGLILILLATFAVVQTQSVTVSPVEADLSSLFEPKVGQLTLQAPPYCGPFDVFCFLILLFRLIFQRQFGLIPGFVIGFATSTAARARGGGGVATVGAGNQAATTVQSTCASGRAGRNCRRAARAARR